jgi:hypothetical protein
VSVPVNIRTSSTSSAKPRVGIVESPDFGRHIGRTALSPTRDVFLTDIAHYFYRPMHRVQLI